MSKMEKQGKRGRATVRKVRRAERIANAPLTEVTVTFRHVEPTDAIRLYAEQKFAHVGKLIKRTCQAHLILTVDKYRQHGEVTVKSGRLSVTAQEETKDLYSVIDLLDGQSRTPTEEASGKIQGEESQIALDRRGPERQRGNLIRWRYRWPRVRQSSII